MRPAMAIAIISVLLFVPRAQAQGLPAPSASEGSHWAATQPPPLPSAGPGESFARPVPLRIEQAPESSRVMSMGQPQPLSHMPTSGPAFPMLIPPGLTQAAPLNQPITVLNAEHAAGAEHGQVMPTIDMTFAQMPPNPAQPVPDVTMPHPPAFNQQYQGNIAPQMMNQPYSSSGGEFAPMNMPMMDGSGMMGGDCNCGNSMGYDSGWGFGSDGCGCNSGGALIPFGYGGAYASNRRVTSRAGAFFPFWQDHDSVVFADLRGQWDDQDAGEANFGLGYRMYLDPYWIFGNYLYWDILSTNQSNVFHQATLGFELLSLDWEARANISFPGSWDSPANSSTGISNRTVITQGFQERAYPGFDAEVGHRFLHWGWNDRCELRWYLGGYYYEHSADGFPSFGGPRGRIEFRIYDLSWLGPQSRVVMGVEGSYDRINNEQIAGFFRFQLPFGSRATRPVLDPLRRRFVDAPQRDID